LKVGGASSGRGHGERVEREPITGVWGRSPPEAESFLVLERPTERQNLSRCQFSAKCSIGTYGTGLLPKFIVYGSNWVCRPKMNRFLRNKQLDGKYNTSTIDDMPRKCLLLDFFGGIGVIPPILTSVTVAWSVGPWQ